MQKLKAFSLAEILIAMTIIGIVAILTFPNLMTDTSSTALRTKFKTVYTQLQDGLIYAENVQKHSFIDVGTPGTNNAKYSIDQFMRHHFNAGQVARSQGPNGLAYKLKNGAHVIFPQETQTTMATTGCDNSHPCLVYIDVNGNTSPNEIVECTTGLTNRNDVLAACTVDENVISDIFEIKIQRSRITPYSNATNYVLNH